MPRVTLCITLCIPQFFIVKKDAQLLNNQYTLFGQVMRGMDIVGKIAIGDAIQSITIE